MTLSHAASSCLQADREDPVIVKKTPPQLSQQKLGPEHCTACVNYIDMLMTQQWEWLFWQACCIVSRTSWATVWGTTTSMQSCKEEIALQRDFT